MTGVQAWLVLAALCAVWPAGRRARRHLLETRAIHATLTTHHTTSEVAYRAEVAAARAAAQATAVTRAARSAAKAAEGQALRPWAWPIGDRT